MRPSNCAAPIGDRPSEVKTMLRRGKFDHPQCICILCSAAKRLSPWTHTHLSPGAAGIPSLHTTVERLTALRRQYRSAAAPDAPHLAVLDGFGSNPGALTARTFIPARLPAGAPLVVVLHGCTQSASGYDRGSGWSSAAQDLGFAVLLPEQQRANNPNLCFNWFSPADARRGGGEALSIRQMIAAMHARHGTDPARVYVTGLSAGGAMAAVMLATYPELFAGGAVIAGLPFGTARSVPEALERMRGHGLPKPAELAQLVRSASGHTGPWPTLSVWHGSADATVDLINARALLDQWRGLHGLAAAPSRTDTVSGYPHRVWTDSEGRDLIEDYSITGMGHGTPLAGGAFPAETAGPHMLEARISSTREVARFWGLGGKVGPERSAPAATGIGTLRYTPASAGGDDQPGVPRSSAASGVQKTIEDALRAAGLIKP